MGVLKELAVSGGGATLCKLHVSVLDQWHREGLPEGWRVTCAPKKRSLAHLKTKVCLSMSKYPLGSNLGGTGDWGGDWGFRVGIGFLTSFTR